MDNLLFLSISIFVLLILLALLGFSWFNIYRNKKGVQERVRKETEPEYDQAFGKDRKWKEAALKLLRSSGEVIRPKKEEGVAVIRKKLVRAGYHGETSLEVFLGLKALIALAIPALVIVLQFAVLDAFLVPRFLALMFFSAGAGFYLPDLYLYRTTTARRKKMLEGFPDALDLMVVCVEAGMALDSAIKRVGDEMIHRNEVLSEEFKIVSLEVKAGKPRAEALRNLAGRTGLEEVSSLVSLLIQTDQFGTKVGQALRVHSDAMRTKRYQRAEEIAAKLPVKIVFPLLFFIFPALFVTIIGPAAITIYRNFTNR